MTDSTIDNRTTELREKLDELGIEHHDFDKGGRTQTMWKSLEDTRHFTYETAANPAKTARLVIEWFPTPEQAIAATLGSELNPDGLPVGLTISDDGDLLNWRGENYVKQATLGSGKCENIAEHWGEFLCSECGMYADFGSDIHRVSTCPHCGKAVKL